MKKLNILKAPEFGVSIALIGLFILMSFLSPLFLSGYNLINILLQSSTYIILSIGMTFVIVTGGIDLSVGSIAVVSGILMASLMKSGTNVFIAILAGLIISILCGFINGFLVSKINLPSFIVTLATMSIFQGAALIFSGGLPIYGFPKSFSFLGIGSILSIPIPVIIALICIIISIFIFKKTKIGHYALAIGDNRQAVKMCGINIFKYEMIVYMINGFTTGIAAIITTARLNSAEPLGSMSMGLDAVAAPSEGDASAQLNYLETMLIKGYDALCISPINPFNLIPAVSKATQRKIPVIAVGTYVDEQAAKNAGAKINGMLAVDFEYQGRLPGQYIVEKFKGEKNVKVAIIEGIPGSAQSEGRKNGCISELAKSPNMKIVSVQPGNWDRTTALNVTSNLIQANPDLDVIFCANDTMALASVEALKAVGKKDQVMVIGCDFIEEAKESIEKGELDATLAMSPYLYGYIGGVMAYKTIINGNYTTDIQVPIKIVDKSNLKEYHDWK